MRNSVGEDSYVADEVIISRNKLRVRIGNTDAEGRMILGDVLCKVRYTFCSCCQVKELVPTDSA